MPEKSLVLPNQVTERLAKSALDKNRITGLTHNFYRYPARFSPSFASTAIELFSNPGDLILDPYMGGGTTIVEAVLAGRRVIGTDLNSLAIFIAKVKTTRLNTSEKDALCLWAKKTIPLLKYNLPADNTYVATYDQRTKNMSVPRARFIKKVVDSALRTINNLPTCHSRNFARCAILKTAQWALDGRKTHVPLFQYRLKLQEHISEMLEQLDAFVNTVMAEHAHFPRCMFLETDAGQIDKIPPFSTGRTKVDLIVTSPPYPGLHILYHRWQVNGRRETPAPYWIAECQDGQGDAYYNFGSRHQPGLHSYFETSLRTLKAIRKVMHTGAYIVQMIAFSDLQNQLPRYLANMESAGFKEVNLKRHQTISNSTRIWRDVPNRKWHASLQGRTSGSKEVVLVHVAS
jgi:DNA modification methylase